MEYRYLLSFSMLIVNSIKITYCAHVSLQFFELLNQVCDNKCVNGVNSVYRMLWLAMALKTPRMLRNAVIRYFGRW